MLHNEAFLIGNKAFSVPPRSKNKLVLIKQGVMRYFLDSDRNAKNKYRTYSVMRSVLVRFLLLVSLLGANKVFSAFPTFLYNVGSLYLLSRKHL